MIVELLPRREFNASTSAILPISALVLNPSLSVAVTVVPSISAALKSSESPSKSVALSNWTVPKNSLITSLSIFPPSIAVIVSVEEGVTNPNNPASLTTVNCKPNSLARSEDAVNCKSDKLTSIVEVYATTTERKLPFSSAAVIACDVKSICDSAPTPSSPPIWESSTWTSGATFDRFTTGSVLSNITEVEELSPSLSTIVASIVVVSFSWSVVVVAWSTIKLPFVSNCAITSSSVVKVPTRSTPVNVICWSTLPTLYPLEKLLLY